MEKDKDANATLYQLHVALGSTMQMHARRTLLFDTAETDHVYATPEIGAEYPACYSLLLEDPPAMYGDIAPSPEPNMCQVFCCDVFGNPLWVPIAEELVPLARGILRTVAHVYATLQSHLPPEKQPPPLPPKTVYISKRRAKTYYNAFIANVLKRYSGTEVPRRVRMQIAVDEYKAFQAKQKEDAKEKCKRGVGLSICSVDTEASRDTSDPEDGK